MALAPCALTLNRTIASHKVRARRQAGEGARVGKAAERGRGGQAGSCRAQGKGGGRIQVKMTMERISGVDEID